MATTVGSFGVSISGGERQRIALARLLIARRPFVILDEPTEHLDGPTADALSETMATALASSTVLTITHRLIGLETADLIVELQDGRVAARGTHAELMARRRVVRPPVPARVRAPGHVRPPPTTARRARSARARRLTA